MQLPKPQKKRGYCMTSFKSMAEALAEIERLKAAISYHERDQPDYEAMFNKTEARLKVLQNTLGGIDIKAGAYTSIFLTYTTEVQAALWGASDE